MAVKQCGWCGAGGGNDVQYGLRNILKATSFLGLGCKHDAREGCRQEL